MALRLPLGNLAFASPEASFLVAAFAALEGLAGGSSEEQHLAGDLWLEM